MEDSQNMLLNMFQLQTCVKHTHANKLWTHTVIVSVQPV